MQWRPVLPEPSGREPKQVYRDSTVIVMVVVHVAWQMGYEEVVGCFSGRHEAAQAAGFNQGRVIGASQ